MQPNKNQEEVLKRLANDEDGRILVTFLEDLIHYYADVRTIPTTVGADALGIEIRGRQLLSTILETELISRLTRKETDKVITEEFE